ncbi:MAG: hypothetical protein JWM85_303 [Acidimicrobiaceae bacterium]|nr:hypothetical protein [Acidimicrobiaceae bacterium]
MTAPGTAALLDPLRRAALAGVREALGGEPGDLDEYRGPAGDPGLFGPGSMVWAVHADLPSMLVGGFSALMLQTLHPLAMAGVAGHSRYREDPLGRLRRTARYVAGTSFGGAPLVEQLVGEVRRVHARVRGVAPDGRPYSADDPELLTWVHSTEVWSFLRSYQRYSLRPLLPTEQDRYLDEAAVLGDLLGAVDVPRSRRQARAYFRRMEAELSATPQAHEAISFLRTPLAGRPADVIAHRVVSEAAIDLLPAFARRQLGFGPLHPLASGVLPGAGPVPTRVAATGFAFLVRWAVGPSAVRAVASRRVAEAA